MSMIEDGIMVILSSPSGAGKTTLVKLLSEKKKFQISISHTTRKPRINEIDGKDYYFVNHQYFEESIKNLEFLEYAEVFKNFYGTKKDPVIKLLKDGKNVIFDIDWQGAQQIKSKKLKYKLITFFVLPPSKEILFQRLSNRDMKDKLIVEERMKEFEKDILHWKDYDYVVVNNKLDDCYNQILTLIECEIMNKEIVYDKKKIENHIKTLRG